MWIELFISLFCVSKVYSEPGPAVALVVGGVAQQEPFVELYSPEGSCNKLLQSIDIGTQTELRRPILALLNDTTILACGGGESNKFCWRLIIEKNIWEVYTKSNHAHDYKPGVGHKSILYIADDENAEKFDVNASKWSYWPSPPIKTGFDPCMVELNNKLYLIGGVLYEKGIQVFDILNDAWSVIPSPAPFPIVELACTTFSTDTIIVVGKNPEKANAEVGATFNIGSSQWTLITNEKLRLQDTLVRLNNRAFVIGGLSGFTEEYKNGILEDTTSKLQQNRLLGSAISIPASMVPKEIINCVGIA